MSDDEDTVFAAIQAVLRLRSREPTAMSSHARSVASPTATPCSALASRTASALLCNCRGHGTASPAGADRSGTAKCSRWCDRLHHPAIARHLVVSPKTIRNHVSNILTKLQATNREDAARIARQAGLGPQSTCRHNRDHHKHTPAELPSSAFLPCSRHLVKSAIGLTTGLSELRKAATPRTDTEIAASVPNRKCGVDLVSSFNRPKDDGQLRTAPTDPMTPLSYGIEVSNTPGGASPICARGPTPDPHSAPLWQATHNLDGTPKQWQPQHNRWGQGH